ncbi:MAG: pilus assembly protein [Nocardiopsaceae bacterium]|nr:pilus assembly protein [Nocardiopsaceae bacterium]
MAPDRRPGRRSGRTGRPGPHPQRRAGWRRSGDRGSSAVELAVLAPVMLFATMLIVQFALWFDARHAALAAAQAGDRIARQEAASNPAWQSDARTQATSYYNALGTRLLTSVQVPPPALDRAANQVSVTVTGRLAGVLPWHMTIAATAGGPVECFRPANGGGACG